MTDAPKTLTDIAEFVVDWNDKAAAWMKQNRDYWDDGTSEADKEFDQVSIGFDRGELDLFMRNQQEAAKWLRLMAVYIADKEAGR